MTISNQTHPSAPAPPPRARGSAWFPILGVTVWGGGIWGVGGWGVGAKTLVVFGDLELLWAISSGSNPRV